MSARRQGVAEPHRWNATLTDIRKSYTVGHAEQLVLRGVDLTIVDRTLTVVLGPSGSGKSTLLHILGCLLRPTTGTYVLDGRDMATLSERERAVVRNREIGFVFQRFNLIPDLTVLQNVALPLAYRRVRKRERHRQALEWLAALGMDSLASKWPSQLSAGEEQRVAVCRALIGRPQMILADEPTGNVDAANRDRIVDLLLRARDDGAAVVLVTHDVSLTERADRVLHMRNGCLVEAPA